MSLCHVLRTSALSLLQSSTTQRSMQHVHAQMRASPRRLRRQTGMLRVGSLLETVTDLASAAIDLGFTSGLLVSSRVILSHRCNTVCQGQRADT
jgi:hypothetical protein